MSSFKLKQQHDIQSFMFTKAHSQITSINIFEQNLYSVCLNLRFTSIVLRSDKLSYKSTNIPCSLTKIIIEFAKYCKIDYMSTTQRQLCNNYIYMNIYQNAQCPIISIVSNTCFGHILDTLPRIVKLPKHHCRGISVQTANNSKSP